MALALRIPKSVKPRKRARIEPAENLDLDIYIITELGFPAA